MQNSMTAIAHGRAYPLFFMPTDEKYTPKTYIIVSELPMITDAHAAVKLSAPYFDSISEYIAVDALPDTGLVKSNGKSPSGTPTASAAGEISSEIACGIPDAFSILTPTSSSTNVGSNPTAVFNPSTAPSLK